MHRRCTRDLPTSFLTCILLSLLTSQQAVPVSALCPAASSPPVDADSISQSSASGVTEDDNVDNQWTEHGAFCYRFVASQRPWYPAELVCRSWGGHLVSIRSVEENRLVGRLSGCQGVWIGRFATDYHRVEEASSYEWTDDEGASGRHRPTGAAGEVGFYNLRNDSTTSSIPDKHAGAVRAENLAWVNTHYHERLPFVCKAPNSLTDSGRCLTPLVQFNNHCYWLSDFATSFVDANLHCERELGGHLASVHSPAEVRFIASLELDSDTCQLPAVWLGLIRQSPCRRSATEGGGNQQPCYQWIDFSGEHTGYPRWARGQPVGADDVEPDNASDKLAWRTNCASLGGDGLHSERCHSRRRFVCKVQVDKATGQRDLKLSQTKAAKGPEISATERSEESTAVEERGISPAPEVNP